MSAISAADLQRVKQGFFLRGESVAEWARSHGFQERQVYSVLSGRNKANRGHGHAIAVQLGLKPPEPSPLAGVRP